MKYRIPIALVGLFVAGAAASCFSLAQDPNSLYRSNNGTTVLSTGGNQGIYTYAAQGSPTVTTAQIASDVANNNEVAKLMQKYTAATAETDKKEVVTQLSEAVAKQFDARQEAKLQELQKLEEQVAKLKELHAKRSQQKDRIVNDRVQQLILEADGLGWGTSEGNRSWIGGYGYGMMPAQVDPFSAAATGGMTSARSTPRATSSAAPAIAPASGSGRANVRSTGEPGQNVSPTPR